MIVTSGLDLGSRLAQKVGIALNGLSIKQQEGSNPWKSPAYASNISWKSWDTCSNPSESSDTDPIHVWVGNLPESVTEADLAAFFTSVPSIVRIKLTTNRPDKRPCAFLSVGDTDSLEAALRLCGERLHGNRIKVEYDPSRAKKEFGNSGFKQRSRFVQGLTFSSYPCLSSVFVRQEKNELVKSPMLPASSELQVASWESPPRQNTRFQSGAVWDKGFNNSGHRGLGWETSMVKGQFTKKTPSCSNLPAQQWLNNGGGESAWGGQRVWANDGISKHALNRPLFSAGQVNFGNGGNYMSWQQQESSSWQSF